MDFLYSRSLLIIRNILKDYSYSFHREPTVLQKAVF